MGIVRIVIFDEFFSRVIHTECIVINCDIVYDIALLTVKNGQQFISSFSSFASGIEWKVSMSVMNVLRIRKVDFQNITNNGI